MTRRMLINGRYAEELRMAIAEDNVLESYKVEMEQGGVERGNVYRGVVANIEPSLDAAFIDYGNEKHGFLAEHDLIAEAYHRQPSGEGREVRIEQVLERGRPILVQVARDAVGTKGAVLTTHISLAGRYLVLMPFDSAHGMSRKVEDEEVRKSLKQKVKSLIAEGGYGFIVRTNAVDQTKTELKHDLDQLVRSWNRILQAGSEGKGPRLLHNDQDLIVQALRDHLGPEIDEIVVDDERLLARAEEYLDAAMPARTCSIGLYRDRIPLFSRHNLEPQILAIYRRSVPLPGGGSIVIDPTEALTAIDVNSGKSTGAGSQEETAYATNLEAAREVARQLRLRDIGGLVVVDFIDMRAPKQRREVERTLKEAMKRDKARSRLGKISANGLLEINRQRIQQAIGVRAHRLCPSCQGSGRLLSLELQALHLLRRIESGAATGRMRRARVSLHPALAETVQNRRRGQIAALEAALNIEVEIVGDASLAPGEDRVQWTEREVGPEEQPAREVRAEPPGAPGPKKKRGGRRDRDTRELRPVGRRGAAPSKSPAVTPAAEDAVQEIAPVEAPASGAGEQPGAASTETPPSAAPPPVSLEGKAADAAQAPAAGSEPGRSRRRRRRGRRAAPGVPPSAVPPERPPSAPAEPATAAPAGEEARRRRRRRGGRRRRGNQAGGGPPA